MNDNDCVSRAAVINIAMQYCPDDDGSCSKADVDLREMLDELENLSPAVPHEMSAMEFFPKWFEICNTYLSDDCYHCPLYLRTNHRKFTPPCMYLMMTDSEEAVAIVEKWAQEHQEEVNDE